MKSNFEKHYSIFSRCDPKAFEVDSNGDYKLKTVKDAWKEWQQDKVRRLLRK